MSNTKKYDVIVVGAGPTGASAAIFLAKGGKKTLLLDNGLSITRRALIENHYGIPGEITGPEMLERGREQAKAVGADVVEGTATGVEFGDDLLTVETNNNKSYEASEVMLCTGMNTDLAETLNLDLEPGKEPHVRQVIVVDDRGRTSREHVWAAGTIAGSSVHTIITAGDGARVAVNLLSKLEGQRHVQHDVLPRD